MTSDFGAGSGEEIAPNLPWTLALVMRLIENSARLITELSVKVD